MWAGPALLPKNGKLLFGSTAKSGKSYVMLSLARALSTGEKPWECPHFEVPRPAKTLLIEAELGKYGLQKRVKPVFGDIQPPEKLDDLLWYVSKDPLISLSHPDGRLYLENMVAEIEPEVLLLDPIGKMHTYDENSNTEINRLFLHIDRLLKDFERFGMSVVISHHFGKPSRDPDDALDPLSPYMMRGASKWYDDPDTLGTFQRKQNLPGRTDAWNLHCRWECRQGEAPGDMVFSVNRDGDWRVRYERELTGQPKPAPLGGRAKQLPGGGGDYGVHH